MTTGGLLALVVAAGVWLARLARPKLASMLDGQDDLIARQRAEIAELRAALAAAHREDVQAAAKIADLEARLELLTPDT